MFLETASEGCSDIFFVETKKWEDFFSGYSLKRPEKSKQMAPLSEVFTKEVSKHDGQ